MNLVLKSTVHLVNDPPWRHGSLVDSALHYCKSYDAIYEPLVRLEGLITDSFD